MCGIDVASAEMVEMPLFSSGAFSNEAMKDPGSSNDLGLSSNIMI